MTGWETKEREGAGEGGRGQRRLDKRARRGRGREDGEEVGKGEVMESGGVRRNRRELDRPVRRGRRWAGRSERPWGDGERAGRWGKDGLEGREERGRRGGTELPWEAGGGGREKTGRDRREQGKRGEAWGERAGEGEAEAERAFGRRCVYAPSPNGISPPQWQDTRLARAALLPLE